MADFIQNGGTNGGSYASHFSGILSVWENSYDVGNNTSNIGYRLQLKSGSSGRFSDLTASYSVTINGTTIKSGNGRYSSQSYNTTQTICEGTMTITHNDDGSKTIACSAVLDFQTNSYSPGDFTPSGTLTLTTIPRASSISCTTANIEENAVITINSASSNFRHSVWTVFGNETFVIADHSQAGGTFQWKIPESFYKQIPNSKSGTGTIGCTTYNGNTLIGEKATQFTVTTNETKCKPTLSETVVDENQTTINLTGSNSKLVKNKSTAKITITTSAKNSATIQTRKVNNTTVSSNTYSISNVSTTSFVITVTDSRGYTNSVTLKPTIVNYIPLTISATIKRTQPTTGEVDIAFSGNYFNGSFGSVSNTLTINWYYREKGNSTWTSGGTLAKTISGNKYNNGTSTISLGKIFNYQKEYEFYLKVVDKLATLQPNYKVTQGIPVFNWGKDFVNINGGLSINDIPVTANKIVTTTEEDLNNYVENGIYFFSSNYTQKNITIGVNGWLQVMNRGNTSIAKQIWYRYGSINTNDYQIYVRTLGDTSGWSSWRRLMCEDDLYYKSGDSVTLNNIVSAGFVTTSATEIYFSVYLPKMQLM